MVFGAHEIPLADRYITMIAVLVWHRNVKHRSRCFLRAGLILIGSALGQLHLNKGYLFCLLFALRNVPEHCNVGALFFDLAEDHAGHEVSKDVGVTGGVVLLNLPQALVEGKFRAVLLL